MSAALLAIAAPPLRATDPAFRFQNNFWVNLHHVLRGEARRRSAGVPLNVRVEELRPGEGPAWSAALDAYTGYAGRDLIFDRELVRLNNVLTLVSGDAAPVMRDKVTSRALALAAPIYRVHYWPAQRQLNERWMEIVQQALAVHGAAMAEALARAYRVEWPASPIIVDACAEAGPNGAYTTDGPPGTAAHTVVEAANPELQGDMGFEMLFHEASHASAIEGRIISAVSAEAARQHVIAPQDLAHAMIFYTAGELARRTLPRAGARAYMPYAYRYGVYTRGWQPLRDALERDWQPYLDGAATFDMAMAALIRDTAKH